FCFFFLILLPPLRSTLFPYTTLFRSAYGVHVSFGGSLLVLATAILATMLPLSPGNLGTYEASVFLVYRYLGVSPEVALSLAIVQDRKSTRLNSSHSQISYAVFCLKKK